MPPKAKRFNVSDAIFEAVKPIEKTKCLNLSAGILKQAVKSIMLLERAYSLKEAYDQALTDFANIELYDEETRKGFFKYSEELKADYNEVSEELRAHLEKNGLLA